MKVKELIEKLEKLNPNDNVFILKSYVDDYEISFLLVKHFTKDTFNEILKEKRYDRNNFE